MAILLLIDLDMTNPCLTRRKMFLLSKEMQAVTFVSSSGKINLDCGTGSVLWELQMLECCTTLPSGDFSRYNTSQTAAFPH